MSDEVVEKLELLSLDFFTGSCEEIIGELRKTTAKYISDYNNITLEPDDCYIAIMGSRDMNEDELKQRQEKVRKEQADQALDALMKQTISKIAGS